MMNIVETNTTLLLFPIFGLTDAELQLNGFKNAYLRDIHHPTDEQGAVYALFRPVNAIYFEKMVENLDNRGLLMEDYDYEDRYVVVLLRIPSQWLEDFHKVVEGKYSTCSEEFKNLFPKTVKYTQNGVTHVTDSLPYRVYYKTEQRRKEMEKWLDSIGENINDMGPDFEYWSCFDERKETLNIDEILKESKSSV